MVRQAVIADKDHLLRMRQSLYPEYSVKELLQEVEEGFLGLRHGYYEDTVTFVYSLPNGGIGGFVELSLIKAEKVNYLERYMARFEEISRKSILPRLEAWYVDKKLRSKKIGSMLVEAAEGWALSHRYGIILSDTDTYRNISIKAHQSMGYSIVAEIPENSLILFGKRLYSNEQYP